MGESQNIIAQLNAAVRRDNNIDLSAFVGRNPQKLRGVTEGTYAMSTWWTYEQTLGFYAATTATLIAVSLLDELEQELKNAGLWYGEHANGVRMGRRAYQQWENRAYGKKEKFQFFLRHCKRSVPALLQNYATFYKVDAFNFLSKAGCNIARLLAVHYAANEFASYAVAAIKGERLTDRYAPVELMRAIWSVCEHLTNTAQNEVRYAECAELMTLREALTQKIADDAEEHLMLIMKEWQERTGHEFGRTGDSLMAEAMSYGMEDRPAMRGLSRRQRRALERQLKKK